MRKYKKGQTWPVFKGAKAGIMLLFSDKELREGNRAFKQVRVPYRADGSQVVKSKRTIHDTHLKTVEYTHYPAGKPLKTDTEIRRFRRKWMPKLWVPEWIVPKKKR